MEDPWTGRPRTNSSLTRLPTLRSALWRAPRRTRTPARRATIPTLRARCAADALLPAKVSNGHERKHGRVPNHGDEDGHWRRLAKYRVEKSAHDRAAWRIQHDVLQWSGYLVRLHPQPRQEQETKEEHATHNAGRALCPNQGDDNQAQREDLGNAEGDGQDEERDVNAKWRTEDHATANHGYDDCHDSEHEVDNQLSSEQL